MRRTSQEEHICGTYASRSANVLFCVKKLSAISDFLLAWSAQLLVRFLMRSRLWLWFQNTATLLSSQSSYCSPDPDQPPLSASEGYEVGRGWSRANLPPLAGTAQQEIHAVVRTGVSTCCVVLKNTQPTGNSLHQFDWIWNSWKTVSWCICEDLSGRIDCLRRKDLSWIWVVSFCGFRNPDRITGGCLMSSDILLSLLPNEHWGPSH